MYEHVEDDGDGDGGGDGDGDGDDDDDDEGEEEEEEDDDTEEEEQEEETGHKTAPHDWCKPAQSKCISRFHKRHQKSHFRRKFTGKMPRPRLSPERQDTHTHCLRACAVETHIKISQEPLQDTAFLQQIFNHQKIKAHFDHFASLRALAIITG